MTATDELRRMLDEWGVEWREGNASDTIEWHTHDGGHCSAMYWNPSMSVCISGCTPAQAVEATLGRGECHDTENREGRFTCSECGYEFSSWGGFGCDCGDDPDFTFCPNCGRRVMATFKED